MQAGEPVPCDWYAMSSDGFQVYGGWRSGCTVESVRYEGLDLPTNVRRVHVCHPPHTVRIKLTRVQGGNTAYSLFT